MSEHISHENKDSYVYINSTGPLKPTIPQSDGTEELDTFPEYEEDYSPPVPAPEVYQCQYCSLMFLSRTYLKDHIEFDHSQFQVFKCYKCDLALASHELLSAHIAASHYSEPSTLDTTWVTPEFLVSNLHSENSVQFRNHIGEQHENSQYFACYLCNLFFFSLGDFETHTKQYHHDLPYFCYMYQCELCCVSFPLQKDLMKHLEAEHSLQNFPQGMDGLNQEMFESDPPSLTNTVDVLSTSLESPSDDCLIPQVDGINQELFEFSDLPPDNTVRKASYSLNQAKQMSKIRDDAALDDFQVTVNNNDQNVTIKCSSGFYIQVAKASFVTMKKHSVFSAADVAITVDEVTVTTDQKGLEATMLMHFSFMDEKVALGGVAVHLHHSTRTIQLQGSSVMPDSSRAALWFLNNVSLKKFKDIAKSKKFEIKNFNKAARNVLQTATTAFPDANTNTCHACTLIFNTKSKPSQCNSCSKFFHKMCIRDHGKFCRKHPPVQSTLASIVPASASIALASSSVSSVELCSTPLGGSSLTDSTPAFTISASRQHLQSSQPPAAVTESFSTFPSSSRVRTAVTFVSASIASSGAACPMPSSSISQQCSRSTSRTSTVTTTNIGLPRTMLPIGNDVASKTSKTNAKKKQKSIPTTADEHTVETLERELGAAQARIAMLDAELNDKKNECTALYKRIKILEEKENAVILDKYFPHANTNSNEKFSSAPTNAATSANRPQSGSSCGAQSSSIAPHDCPAFHVCPPSSCHFLSLCQPRSHCQPKQAVQNDSCNHSTKVFETRLESSINQIEILQTEMTEIRKLLTEPTHHPEVNRGKSPMDDYTPDASTNVSNANHDASTASVEEFIDDPTFNPVPSSSKDLNCQDQTIQL
jgi:hypothetical protein